MAIKDKVPRRKWGLVVLNKRTNYMVQYFFVSRLKSFLFLVLKIMGFGLESLVSKKKNRTEKINKCVFISW